MIANQYIFKTPFIVRHDKNQPFSLANAKWYYVQYIELLKGDMFFNQCEITSMYLTDDPNRFCFGITGLIKKYLLREIVVRTVRCRGEDIKTAYFMANGRKISFWKIFFSHCEEGMKIILNHEFSRRACSWDLICVRENINLDVEIEEFLERPNIYLAGGALTSILMEKRVHDYDIFFVGECLEYQVFIDQIKQKYTYVETFNSVTFYINTHRIQIIKRIYSSVNQIIGGFDVDPCRFIYIKKNIYSTPAGQYSLRYQVNYINRFNSSETFCQRIKKYKRKGFMPVNPHAIVAPEVIIKPNSFSLARTYDCYYQKADRDLRINTLNLLKGRLTQLFICDKIYELNDFVNEYKKEKVYFDIKLGSVYFFNKSYKEIIMENYKHYKRIGQIILSNPHSQFTGSFYPIKINPNAFNRLPNSLSIDEIFPDIYFQIWILKKKFNKYLAHMILKYYYVPGDATYYEEIRAPNRIRI